jgi:hypothetical protein
VDINSSVFSRDSTSLVALIIIVLLMADPSYDRSSISNSIAMRLVVPHEGGDGQDDDLAHVHLHELEPLEASPHPVASLPFACYSQFHRP